ncbi:alanine/glycine:cation symporter family protein [Qiania dongpingensis]|uniref:Sodium:alanine symporter family protein n=1 Tax=Qiania dongpingensis TaxID=2763669 RepID=A0A7G9G5W5_9FIRM|nr:sodium:alanine symporter family protein [Qiania dongpingensis]QNM06197.1 sodium:alanine symporter family protein [Qiania dongpingensis]
MKVLENLLGLCNNFVWGIPMMALLFGTHLLLTIRLRAPQRKIFKALRLSVTEDEDSEGEMSQFGALATALAATLGTGNIIGVSIAVAMGGPGAVAWCWLTGVFGMATKYGESLLSVKYRVKDKDGGYVGGPMYVMENVLHCKPLAVVFAFFAICATFGTGCTVQANAISSVMSTAFNVKPAVTGAVVSVLAAIVMLGGAKAVSRACEKLVPFMAIFYMAGSGALLFINRAYLFPALKLIVTAAFTPRAALGGFVGSTILSASRHGIARGLFSDESGLGTAPMAAASARTRNSVRQALVSMTGTFWDTVVFCAVTGIVIVSSMLHKPAVFNGLSGGQLAEQSFGLMNQYGHVIFAVSLVIFAFATILGWSFYGERAVIYLFGGRGIKYYRLIYLAALFAGAVASMGVIWEFSDLLNGLMAVPNLICLLILQGVIVKETRYFLWGGHLDEKEELGE